MGNFEQVPQNKEPKEKHGSARPMTQEELEEFAEDLAYVEGTQGHKQNIKPEKSAIVEDDDLEDDDLDIDLDTEK